MTNFCQPEGFHGIFGGLRFSISRWYRLMNNFSHIIDYMVISNGGLDDIKNTIQYDVFTIQSVKITEFYPHHFWQKFHHINFFTIVQTRYKSIIGKRNAYHLELVQINVFLSLVLRLMNCDKKSLKTSSKNLQNFCHKPK